MAIPTLNFTLHVAPTDDVAEGEGDMDSLFPHTPRNDASWFEADPPAELIEQCLRPGHCVVPEGEVCEWFHRKLAQLGHAFNEVGLFGNQNTVCQPRATKWRHTVERLKGVFPHWDDIL